MIYLNRKEPLIFTAVLVCHQLSAAKWGSGTTIKCELIEDEQEEEVGELK